MSEILSSRTKQTKNLRHPDDIRSKVTTFLYNLLCALLLNKAKYRCSIQYFIFLWYGMGLFVSGMTNVLY